VHSDELVADQVIACCKWGRDSDGSIESVEDGVTSPYTSILSSRDKALLKDFDCIAALLAVFPMRGSCTYTRPCPLHQNCHKIPGI
jgi:hypothetical protein